MRIKIDENRCTSKDTIKAGYIYENLAYVLEFEFPDYLNNFNKIIEFEYGNEKTYDALVNNKYTFKSNITKYPIVACQIVFTKSVENQEIQVYKTNKFYVKFDESINADKTINPEDEDISVLDSLINEVNIVLN